MATDKPMRLGTISLGRMQRRDTPTGWSTGKDNWEPSARLIAGDTTIAIGRVRAGASLVLAEQANV